MIKKLWDSDNEHAHTHYLANPGFGSTFVWNCNWLSIIWKSSGGWGILPVSSFDQTGTSGREKHTKKTYSVHAQNQDCSRNKKTPIHTINYAISKQLRTMKVWC